MTDNRQCFNAAAQRYGKVSVSNYFHAWSWFEYHVLLPCVNDETRREAGLRLDLFNPKTDYPNYTRKCTQNRSEFERLIRHYWDITMSDSLPFRLVSGLFGIGVVAKGKQRFSDIQMHLYGFFEPIDKKLFGFLEGEGYNSLYGDNLILFGPIAFLNHLCNSSVYFMNVDDMLLGIKSKGRYARLDGVQLQVFNTSRKKLPPDQVFGDGEEVFVNYNFMLPECRCSCCNRTVPMQLGSKRKFGGTSEQLGRTCRSPVRRKEK